MEAAIPISILAIGLARALPAALHPARERHHHRHRRPGRLGRGGRHLHPAGALHPQARSAPGADHLHLPGGRLPGRAVPDSAAPLLRARHARPASLPRSHRHHRGAGDRREGRLAGASCCCRPPPSPASTISWSPPSTSGRSTSISSSCRVMRALADRARVAFSFDAIGFILGLGYVMGLRSSMILCAGGVLSNLVLVPLIWMIGSHLTDTAVYPGTDPHRADDGGADLPRLRALRRRGRHRHGGHLRHPEIHAHRGRLVRRGAARLPPRAKARPASAPTATFR